ncbi:glycosyltransferase [Flavobacterium caeni]|uniref:Glycosyltransferase involved in cell wall bisynthesis n=1 Tax=Flavobacterium caeni TaxID=490189 RepID=A0A1G5FIU0_9FLAO|nr:glycosyltransferase [Flavobacterium caeni]SCY39077.1 Glycosyltransferase involved in cell wall bisynthesis [Flavobacterium caeni]
MKIAHLCLSLGKGGAEKLLVDSLPMYGAGHDITIIQLSSVLEEPTYIATVEAAGIKVVTLGTGGFKKLSYFFQIAKLLRSGGFDVFHVHLFPCLYYVSVAARFVKKCPILVVTEHSNSNGRSNKAWLNPIEKWVYQKYDAIVAVSPNVEAMLKKRFPGLAAKIHQIKNGVDLDRFHVAQQGEAAIFAAEFQRPSAVKLFMTSRFAPPKDQQTVIMALRELPENFALFFAGDGPEMEQSLRLAQQLGLENRVHFLGFRNDIPQLMRTSDINVLSSLYEGLSGVTLEAMASGRPFLGTDVQGINDVVPDNRFLFEKQNPTALARKILAISNDPVLQSALIQKGLEHVRQFGMRQMVAAYLNLYRELKTR